jgi:hypothetical protein
LERPEEVRQRGIAHFLPDLDQRNIGVFQQIDGPFGADFVDKFRINPPFCGQFPLKSPNTHVRQLGDLVDRQPSATAAGPEDLTQGGDEVIIWGSRKQSSGIGFRSSFLAVLPVSFCHGTLVT